MLFQEARHVDPTKCRKVSGKLRDHGPHQPSKIARRSPPSRRLRGKPKRAWITESGEARPGSDGPDSASAETARGGMNANATETPCPGSLVATSYLECKTEMPGQDEMSWYTASLYSFGTCWGRSPFSRHLRARGDLACDWIVFGR